MEFYLEMGEIDIWFKLRLYMFFNVNVKIVDWKVEFVRFRVGDWNRLILCRKIILEIV